MAAYMVTSLDLLFWYFGNITLLRILYSCIALLWVINEKGCNVITFFLNLRNPTFSKICLNNEILEKGGI